MKNNVKKEFTIKVKMEERWVTHFWGMLKHMQRLGNIGSSRRVTFYSDGDGDFRPEFESNILIEERLPLTNNKGDCFWDAG